MPRKPKLPKPYEPGGISQFDRIGEKRKEYPYYDIYPPEILIPICEKFGITDETVRKKLWHTLEHRYVAYHTALNRKNQKASLTESRNQLIKLEKSLSDFLAEWGRLHPNTEYWMRKAAHELYHPASDDIDALIESGAAKRVDDPNGASEVTFYEPDLQLAGINFLKHQLAKAKELVPKNKGGRPFNLPLYDFVSGMASFWVHELGRPFTIDTFEGKGITESSEFLEECVRPIDSTLIGALPEMMKRVKEDLKTTP